MKNYEDEIPDWEETPLKKNRKLKTLLSARQEAVAAITEAESRKKACSDELLTILTSAGVQKARVEQFAVSIVTTERNSLNEGELKRALLEGGMPLSKIEKLWEKCSSKSQSSYVKVTERKTNS